MHDIYVTTQFKPPPSAPSRLNLPCHKHAAGNTLQTSLSTYTIATSIILSKDLPKCEWIFGGRLTIGPFIWWVQGLLPWTCTKQELWLPCWGTWCCPWCSQTEPCKARMRSNLRVVFSCTWQLSKQLRKAAASKVTHLSTIPQLPYA